MAGSDYIASSATVRFASGETTKTIVVPIANDSVVEPDETFVMNLSSPAGATIGRAQATGMIVNDDQAPVPKIGVFRVAGSGDLELSSGQTPAVNFGSLARKSTARRATARKTTARKTAARKAPASSTRSRRPLSSERSSGPPRACPYGCRRP